MCRQLETEVGAKKEDPERSGGRRWVDCRCLGELQTGARTASAARTLEIALQM